MEVGGKGLAQVTLTIPQGCSVSFDVKHTNERGNPVDHRASVLHMALQTGQTTIDLSECCTGTETGVSVTIPPSATEGLQTGGMVWDLIAEMQGQTVRLAYGPAYVVDTYSLDSHA